LIANTRRFHTLLSRTPVIHIALLFSLNAAPQRDTNDWVIIPNVRVGPITPSSTEASLRESFGARSLITTIPGGDVALKGKVTPVYKDDQANALFISWTDQHKLAHPETIDLLCLEPENSRWRTDSGIRCTTTLQELETRNGTPILLHHRSNPFEIVSWRGGKLEQEFGSPKVFTIWLVPSERYWPKLLTPEENREMGMDFDVLSNDPMIQKLTPKIGRIIVHFPQARDAKPALRKRQ
jgi:hypothetical protein